MLPPASLFLLATAGLLLSLRWPRLGRWLIALAVVPGLALSLPAVSNRLLAWVEAPYARLDPAPARLPTERQARWRQRPAEAPQVIVLLAGGSIADGVQSATPDRVNPQSLERLLHARRLARLTGLPILVSGGVPAGGGEAEALLMRNVLDGDFGQTVRWVEMRSRDTTENARYSRDILMPQGLRRILLVTHAYHMRRAQQRFEAAGFTVIPAPHSFRAGSMALDRMTLTPSRQAMAASHDALREMFGILWYRLPPWLSSIAAR